jgi:hypothetical protein
MQYISPHSLRQQTSREGGNSTSGASSRRNEPNRRHLNVARQQFGEYRLRAGIYRAKQQTENRDCDGITDDIGDEPHEELKCHCSYRHSNHEGSFSNSVSDMREDEST